MFLLFLVEHSLFFIRTSKFRPSRGKRKRSTIVDFKQSGPQCSYKHGSYSQKSVYRLRAVIIPLSPISRIHLNLRKPEGTSIRPTSCDISSRKVIVRER